MLIITNYTSIRRSLPLQREPFVILFSPCDDGMSTRTAATGVI